MSREWRTGTIELLPGYAFVDADGHAVGRAEDVEFTLEGGFVNARLPGVPHTQVVSAPALRLITCTS
ncbi:hypothetical protein C3489_20835 [Streptomyces sp. Ru71]|uniref:hypothetical protein n=1 Tax=Streptomyces sp. Ru71 TaxID=2080746 RepID=UPI000CDD000B|nr:hypothetical protein [Streptomyces sp. Ru71]POX51180.1 hypothetical protein C3489_20835 [Streptomyces sp. Ru71]